MGTPQGDADIPNLVKSYGENLNDLFVLDTLGEKRDGYFVEAGALDGVQVSNTLLLEESYGWTGICVEPDPQLYAELVENRTCICEQVCLYDGSAVTFVTGVRGWGGIVDHLYETTRPNWEFGERVTMPTVTLASILDKHTAPAVIDYLSLDTEGSEAMILGGFPFDRYRFRIITIENSSCNDLLTANGYRVVENHLKPDVPYEQYFLG